MFKCCTNALISHATKVKVKILQNRLQQYENQEHPDVQAGFRKSKNQIANCQQPLDHRKSKGIPEKHLISASATLKPLTVWITTKCGKFFKRWKYQTTLPASWEICVQVKKQQLELDMEQQTGSKLGKEYIKAACCHPAYLTYMQNTSCKMPGRKAKNSLGSQRVGRDWATELTEKTVVAIQLPSHTWLLATAWTAARQASLPFTISWNLLKLCHWVNDAIQTSPPLSPSSPLVVNLSQHQGLFQ